MTSVPEPQAPLFPRNCEVSARTDEDWPSRTSAECHSWTSGRIIWLHRRITARYRLYDQNVSTVLYVPVPHAINTKWGEAQRPQDLLMRSRMSRKEDIVPCSRRQMGRKCLRHGSDARESRGTLDVPSFIVYGRSRIINARKPSTIRQEVSEVPKKKTVYQTGLVPSQREERNSRDSQEKNHDRFMEPAAQSAVKPETRK